MLRLILIILALLFSIVSLKYFTIPYAWICLAWMTVLILFAKASKNGRAKAVWFNLSVVLLVLGSFEIYLYWQDQDTRLKRGIKDDVRNQDGEKVKRAKKHEFLGYAPIKNQKVFMKRHYLNELIFDISYTINADGLRITREYEGKKNRDSVLFFGGSYTFGGGLNDNETMAYLLDRETNGRFRVYNFGWNGYGPHQMLAAIQFNMVENIVECRPKYALYQGVPFHVRRVAGLNEWGKHDPKYILNEHGKAVYKGHFDHKKISKSVIRKKIEKELKKSLILSDMVFQPRAVHQDDIGLMIAIIDMSRTILETKYPSCEFHVIFWDWEGDWVSEDILAGLRQKSIRIHLMSDILPDHDKKNSKYGLHKYDGHPNKLVNELIAEYITNKIIRK